VDSLDVCDWILAYFEEDAASAGGVDEEVQMAACADLNVVGDEAGSLGFQGFKRRGDVVDVERDMVQAFAAFREEVANGRIGCSWLHQLDAGLAGGNHRRAHLLLLNGLFLDDLEAEGFVELARLGDAADGDADVVDLGHMYRVQGTGHRVQGSREPVIA